jgi:hypothetical protein
MPNVTQAEVRTRIEAILNTLIPGTLKTLITNQDQALTDAQLPAALVMSRGRTVTRPAKHIRYVTRTWEVGVLIKRLGTWTESEQRTQLVAAEAFLDAVPDVFDNLDRLALANAPLLGVIAVGEMTDNGLETREFGKFSKDGNVYFAVTYSLDVTTSRT